MAKLFEHPSLFGHLPASPTSTPEPPPSLAEPFSTGDDLPPDWRERAHALDIHRSWIVEAPAGSGKTGLLIQRLLKLLADQTVQQPEEVLAITFTRAATEEIRDRILAQLESAAAGTPVTTPFDRATRDLATSLLQRDRRLGWDLRNQPRRLNIRTIDAVCAEIMGALPVLSGGAGHLRPIEVASPLYREAVRHVLLRLGGPDQPLHHALRTLLERRDGSLSNCENLLIEMLGTREQWGDLIPLGHRALDHQQLDQDVLPRLNLALEEIICSELTRLNTALPEPFLRQLTELAADLSDRPGYKDAPSPIAICRNRYNTPEARIADLDLWRALLHLLVKPSDKQWRSGFNAYQLRITLDAADRTRLKELVEQAQQLPGLLPLIERASALPPAVYPEEQWRIVKALFVVLSAALTELQLVFARHSACDFAEIALQARATLRNEAAHHDLQAALGYDLKHLLVDEMQDTSSGQYDLLHLLTEHWAGERHTVFLVGDPKQSIYLFRQARVERFLRTMRERRLGPLTLYSLRLTANFRSQANLVCDINHDFSRIFPAAGTATDDTLIPFTTAHPIRSANPDVPEDQSLRWHIRAVPAPTPETPPNAETEARQADAASIRDIVTTWRARPLPPGRSKPWSIAVLVRARHHLFEVVAALRGTADQPAIPYRAVNVEQLGERPEILDLLALTRAILHPADRVAWLSLLRAPWCGLELTELHLLAGADDPAFHRLPVPTLLETRASLLASAARHRVQHLHRTLRAAEAQRNQLPLAQLIERTWRSLGGPLPLTGEQHSNVHRFFVLLDQLEDSIGRIDLTRLTAETNRLFAEASAAEDALDLMTIHSAKGLEWDVVLLPALDRDTRKGNTRLLTWEELTGTSPKAAHALLAPIQGRGQPSEALNTWLNNLARDREGEERKRLLYVACTRAREELHLFATIETRRPGDLGKPTKGSLLEAAWPAAASHIEPPQLASITQFPAQTAPAQPASGLDLAAAADDSPEEPQQPAPTIFRLPDGISLLTGQPAPPIIASPPPPPTAPSPTHHRPEGSLLARAFGNTVHALLDRLTQQIASGQPPQDLAAELPAWGGRINTLLRSAGVSPRELPRLTRDVATALRNTLADPTGLWLLSPHPAAASEFSRTLWHAQQPQTVRVDRLFRAGSEPLSDQANCLWLIDYKTATHGRGNLGDFLTGQRHIYAGQLETYARILHGHLGATDTRVALYFPLLRELIWWTPDTTSA